MGNVRNFSLRREGEEQLDSRTAGDGLRAEIAIHHAEVLPDERAVRVAATVRNAGQAIWLPSATPYGGVSLGCHLLDEEGTMISFDHQWNPLGDVDVQPGDERDVELTIPLGTADECVLEFDCVANGICWFAEVGSRPATVRVESGEANEESKNEE